MIIDLNSIDVIDSLVANHLVKVAATLQLVGVETIFCGIKSVVAQTMVNTGIDVGRFKTVRTLKSALAYINELS